MEANAAERLVRALADDIIEGRLKGGDRLPAHRDLAWKLGIGLGTVTKAYATLDRRGLTRSVKGRGTFVAINEMHSNSVIDLSSNVPPAMLTSRLLAQTLSRIARKIDADHLNLYAPPGGHFEHRRVLARWLETLGLLCDARQLIITSNATQALSLALDLACGSTGTVLTERITYPGAISLAKRKNWRLLGVAIDAQGMVPEALADALHGMSAKERKTVYVTPTLHNPTTAMMSAARRTAIADVCRTAGTTIVEDGVYAVAEQTPLPLAALAPDITYHVNGLSKTLGPGLQVGVLSMPAGKTQALCDISSDAFVPPSPISCAIVEDWLTTGVIGTIQRDLRHEARRRSALAVSLLATKSLMAHPDAYNVWLPMPRDAADRFAAMAVAAGIKVTPPGAVLVNPAERSAGIRLCLGGPSIDELTRALTSLAHLPDS
jgi:DNA-binding transcriptional MocR family regulator